MAENAKARAELAKVFNEFKEVIIKELRLVEAVNWLDKIIKRWMS